ncbi:MAG: ABC transporter permease [Bifidobacteriaceae bacterium]|jgi:ribose transport system permease protein|nr:ABC transporter permease [Bifidobacteriaceae bacterium]
MKRRRLPDEMGVIGIVVLVLLVFSMLSPNFRTMNNVQILLLNGAVIAFLALGQTFVLLTGGIDLSTGSNVALTGMLAALAMYHGVPWWGATIIALVAGVLVGIFNGVMVHYAKLPPFIVTFSTFGIAASVPKILTGAQSVSVKDPYFALIGRSSLWEIPMPVVLLIIAAIVLTFVLRRTPMGVHIYAVGGNAETSRLAGISISRVTLTVYGVSGLCAAVGGLITTSRLMVGYPVAGSGNELFYSIASAVVGGVSLFGGIGTIPGALVGSILIATVSNGMNVVGVESYWQPLVIGAIILAGVVLDTYRREASIGQLFSKLARRPAHGPPGGGSEGASPPAAATAKTAAADESAAAPEPTPNQ